MNTSLISKINQYIKSNGSAEITGPVLNLVLRDMVNLSVAEVTYAALATLIANEQVTPGMVYKITDRGDRGIFVTGLNNKTISSEGLRIMLCPATYAVGSFDGHAWKGVWRSTKTASINDLFIWGALVWKNKTGNIGTRESDIELDATNWEPVAKSSFMAGEYVEKNFQVTYDFANDWIEQQRSGKGVLVGISHALRTLLGYTNNPVDATDWNIETSCLTFQDVVAYFGIFNNIFGEHGGVSAVRCAGIANNELDRIQGVTCHPVNYAESDVDVFGFIANNSCGVILDVNQSGGIGNIPDTVDEYSYHSDDSSFYFEWNFDEELLGGPIISGNSVFRNCIQESDTALLEMTVMGVGLSGTGSPQIHIGLETDDESYVAYTALATLNAGIKSTSIGNKTTDRCRRFKISVTGGDVTGGKIKVTGKYI